jgi:hypothetical protein
VSVQFPGDPPIASGNRVAEDHKDWLLDLVEALENMQHAVANVWSIAEGVVRVGPDYEDYLEASATNPASMSVAVSPGVAIVSENIVWIRETTTLNFTKPTSNPRIDLIQVSMATRTVTAKTGVEAVSPVAPDPDLDAIGLFEVYHRTAESSIKDSDDGTNGYLTDVREWAQVFTNADIIPPENLPDTLVYLDENDDLTLPGDMQVYRKDSVELTDATRIAIGGSIIWGGSGHSNSRIIGARGYASVLANWASTDVGVEGVRGYVLTGPIGTVINQGMGVRSQLSLSGEGAITNGYVFHGRIYTPDTGGGTMVNAYGLKLGPITQGSEDNYAIHTQAGKVHLGDDVHIVGDLTLENGLPLPDPPMVLTAQGLTPAPTGGCTEPALNTSSGGGNIYWSADFAANVIERGWFANIALPSNYNAGTQIIVQPIWTALEGSVGQTVKWQIAARCFGDGDGLSDAIPAAVTASDAYQGFETVHIADAVAVTIGGTPGPNKLLTMRIERNGSGDTLAASAKLIGVLVSYTSARLTT